jgi:hypothetical protein
MLNRHVAKFAKIKPGGLCWLFLLLIWAIPVHAQEDLPAPLNAEDVFTDAVMVVESLPLLVSDDTQVSLYDYETENWHTYDYPRRSPMDATFTLLDDDTYLMRFVDVHGYSGEAIGSVWYFDPRTGEFREPATVCGHWVRVISNQHNWIAIWDEEAQGYRLCSMMTGEITPPLEWEDGYFDVLSISPDENWALLKNSGFIYTYEFTTGEILNLGQIIGIDRIGVFWVDVNRVVIKNDYESDVSQEYTLYAMNVSQPHSLQGIYASDVSPVFVNEPRHFEWIGDAQFIEALGKIQRNNVEDCTVHELSLETFEITDYYLPDVCELGILIPDETGDRLAFDDDTGTVIRFNRYSGETQTLFESVRGENIGFSPDGRYFEMVVTSENDALSELKIFDLQSDEMVYSIERITDRERIVWLDDNRFLLYRADDNQLINLANNSVVSLDGSPIARDADYILLHPDTDTLAVYNVASSETTPIAHNLSSYIVVASWAEGGDLRIRLETSEYIPVGDWRVRINDS